MKVYKRILAGSLIGLTSLLMLPTAYAAPQTPAQTCEGAQIKMTQATTTVWLKALVKVCKGKSVESLVPKVLKKSNKAIAKANAVHDEVDCTTNQDPDSLATWPQDALTSMEVADSLIDACDGVMTP